MPLDERFQLSKELFYMVQVGGVRGQEHKLYAGISTHLLDPHGAMKGRIVHHQDRTRLRPSAAFRQKPFDEIFKDTTVGGTLENT